MGCGASTPAEEYTPPPTGATENGPMLSLVRKGAPDALVFEHAHQLSGPGGARLTLASHPGMAVVPRYDYPRSAAEWRYIELGIGPAHMAAHMQLQGEFLVRLHDERVMDIAHWKYEEGNTLNVLRSAHNHPGNTRYTNGGRSFVVNADRTISPMKAQHLVLGASKPTFCFVSQSSPNKCIFEHADRLTGGQTVPLTLSSHPGLAVVQGFDEPREAFHEWHYKALCIGPASRAVHASRRGQNLVDTSDWYVTPSMLTVHDGNHTDLVRNRFDHPRRLLEEHGKHGGARPLDFNFNPDGTISPVSQPHLCLGCSFMPLGAPMPNAVPTSAAVPMATVPVAHVPTIETVPMAVVIDAIPVAAASSASTPPPIGQMVEIFKKQLGIKPSANIAETVQEACDQLDVPAKGALIDQAHQCWLKLGAPPA